MPLNDSFPAGATRIAGDKVVSLSDVLPTSSTGNAQTGTVLAMGIDLQRIITCILEPVNNLYRLVAWQEEDLSIGRLLTDQCADQLRQVGSTLHRRLWDSERHTPLTTSIDVIGRPPIEHTAITASLREPVRVWLAGISQRHSVAAATSAIESTHATIAGETTLASQPTADQLAEDIEVNQPELLILVGGYEVTGSMQPSLFELTALLVNAFRTIPEQQPEIVYAGNSYAYDAIARMLAAQGIRITQRIDNVLPQPGATQAQPLMRAIEAAYLHKCRLEEGFEQIEEWNTYDGDLLSVESQLCPACPALGRRQSVARTLRHLHWNGTLDARVGGCTSQSCACRLYVAD